MAATCWFSTNHIHFPPEAPARPCFPASLWDVSRQQTWADLICKSLPGLTHKPFHIKFSLIFYIHQLNGRRDSKALKLWFSSLVAHWNQLGPLTLSMPRLHPRPVTSGSLEVKPSHQDLWKSSRLFHVQPRLRILALEQQLPTCDPIQKHQHHWGTCKKMHVLRPHPGPANSELGVIDSPADSDA